MQKHMLLRDSHCCCLCLLRCFVVVTRVGSDWMHERADIVKSHNPLDDVVFVACAVACLPLLN